MRAIDGDALSDWLKDYGQKCIKGERKISLMYVWKHIQDMQTIEERKTGKWIPHKSIFGGLGERVYTCDQCGHNIGFHMENYCPNCGSQMIKREQE